MCLVTTDLFDIPSLCSPMSSKSPDRTALDWADRFVKRVLVTTGSSM